MISDYKYVKYVASLTAHTALFNILKRSQTDKNAFTDNLGLEVIFCNNASPCIRKILNLSPLTTKFSAVKLEIKHIIVHTQPKRKHTF